MLKVSKVLAASSKQVKTQAHQLIKSLVVALNPKWYGKLFPNILNEGLIELSKRPLRSNTTEEELIQALNELKPVMDHGAMHGNTGYLRAYNEVLPILKGDSL